MFPDDRVNVAEVEAGVTGGLLQQVESEDARNRVLQAFLRDDVRVVVATTAFGMGIDKP